VHEKQQRLGAHLELTALGFIRRVPYGRASPQHICVNRKRAYDGPTTRTSVFTRQATWSV
jgi:hypothetical protein